MWQHSRLLSRRRLLHAAGALVGLSVLAACAPAAPTPAPAQPAKPAEKPAQPVAKPAPAQPGQVVVSFTSQGSRADLEMFDRIFDQFEKENPRIKIDRKYDTTLTWPKVINQLRTGTASDIIRTNDDDIFLLLAADVITSLDDYVRRDLKMSDYFDVAFKTRVGPGGEIGSALVATAPTVMFYNVELFEKAGVKPPTDWEKDNWTIDDLEQAMIKLTKKSGGRVEIYGWAEPYWWPEVALWNEGVPLYNEDETKAILATPEAIKFISRYQKWYLEGWAVPPGENVTQLFNSGLLAMTYQDMNFANSIKKEVKWDVGPTAKGSVRDGAFHNDRNFTIPKHSKVKDEAWQVLKFWFWMSEDGKIGGQAEIAKQDWGVPVLKRAAESPLFNDPNKPPKNRKIYIQGAAKGWPIPDNPMGEEFQVIFRRIDALRTGKQTPEQFLKEAEEALNRVIVQTGWNKKYNVRGWRLQGIIEKAGRLELEEKSK